MQVNIFISENNDGKPPRLLVLPIGPDAAIPRHMQDIAWRHFAMTATADKLLGAPAELIEAELEKDGFALVSPTG